MSAASQGQGQGHIGSDDDRSVDTSSTPKISLRRLVLARSYCDLKFKGDGSHRDTVDSNALYHRSEYKDVTHTALQLARINIIKTAYPTCHVCGGWRFNNSLREETWRYLPKEVFIAIGKFDINVHKYPEDKLYISDHGRMARWKEDEGSGYPKLSNSMPDTWHYYIRDSVAVKKSTTPSSDVDDDQPPVIIDETLTVQRAVLVYLTFYDVPSPFVYPNDVVDHINEIHFDNHAFNLHILKRKVNQIPRCELPSNNRSGYIGIGEYKSGRHVGKWYYISFKSGNKIYAGDLSDALFQRFESEVDGGMYNSFSPSHIVEMLIRRQGWGILIDHPEAKDLFIKTFISSSIGRLYQQSNNINDDGNPGATRDSDEEDTTPMPRPAIRGQQNENPKKVTPSPHQPDHETPQTETGLTPPTVRRRSKTNVFGQQTVQITQPCCNCDTSISIEESMPRIEVKYCCETCKKLAIKQQFDYYDNNNDDGLSLDQSIIDGLISEGFLPRGKDRESYIRFSNDVQHFTVSHSDNKDIELGPQYESIDALVDHLTQGFHDDVSSLFSDTENNIGIVQTIITKMWGWMYNVDVRIWIDKPYGFKLVEDYQCQGEASPYATINIIRRSDSNGNMSTDFDGLDFTFTGSDKGINYNIDPNVSGNNDAGGIINPAAVGGDYVDEDTLHDLVGGPSSMHQQEDGQEDVQNLGRFFQDIGVDEIDDDDYAEIDLDACDQVTTCPEQCDRLVVNYEKQGNALIDRDLSQDSNILTNLVVASCNKVDPTGGEVLRPGKNMYWVVSSCLYTCSYIVILSIFIY